MDSKFPIQEKARSLLRSVEKYCVKNRLRSIIVLPKRFLYSIKSHAVETKSKEDLFLVHFFHSLLSLSSFKRRAKRQLLHAVRIVSSLTFEQRLDVFEGLLFLETDFGLNSIWVTGGLDFKPHKAFFHLLFSHSRDWKMGWGRSTDVSEYLSVRRHWISKIIFFWDPLQHWIVRLKNRCGYWFGFRVAWFFVFLPPFLRTLAHTHTKKETFFRIVPVRLSWILFISVNRSRSSLREGYHVLIHWAGGGKDISPTRKRAFGWPSKKRNLIGDCQSSTSEEEKWRWWRRLRDIFTFFPGLPMSMSHERPFEN